MDAVQEKKKIMFIINPISGVYRKKNIPEKIARYIDYVKYDYTIRFTQYAGHATLIAQQAVEQGYDVCVAVGGDGSINEVAQSLVGTQTALGVIPYGSGNGFATHLKIPPRDAEGAINVLNTGKIVKLDLIKTNLRYVVSNAGFGIDSSVARRFHHHKIRGFASYAWAVMKELLLYFKPFDAKVEIDDVVLEREFYLFTAFNANQYGYNFSVFPFTSMKDGVMDVIVLNPFPFWKLFYIFFCCVMKRPDVVKEAEIFRARRIKIHGTKKMLYQFDGDSVIWHDDVMLEVVPQCIQVIVPEHLNSF
ncbi:MAG: diacylglycerol kinase family lipid kinase [Chitinophagales bacterium]|nr:diacylglycerol kinase family lipid kinase [Chitinophagales bacterium]MDW8418281.1 diacylglycerol kinase family lipid kinase [Chitinophagales bacterium]